jgi:hypothetical protein
MGQNVKPSVLRIGGVKQWKLKYIGTKLADTAFFDFKAIEIKNFTAKFFKDNGLIVHNYKSNYFNEGVLYPTTAQKKKCTKIKRKTL